MAQALVRVGSSTNIKLNGTSAIRAVTLSDVSAILARKSFEFVVFEGVKATEVEAIKELRKDFRVPMYTFGEMIIDGIDNHVSLSDLQDAIEGTTGIWVRTYGITRHPALWDKVYQEDGKQIDLIELGEEEDPELNEEDSALIEQLNEEVGKETTQVALTDGATQVATIENENKSNEELPLITSTDIENEVERLEIQAGDFAQKAINSLVEELQLYKGLLENINSGPVVVEAEELIKQRDDLAVQLGVAEKQNETLASTNTELVKSISDLREQLSTQRQEMDNLSQSDKELESNKAVIGEYSFVLQELFQKSCAVGASLLHELQLQKTSFNGLSDEYSKLLEDKALLLSDMQELTNEKDRLSRQLVELKRTDDMQIDVAVKAKEQLATQLSELRSELSDVKLSLQKTNSEVVQLSSALELKTTVITQLEEELKEQSQKLSEKELTIQGLNSNLADYAELVKGDKDKSFEIEALNRTLSGMKQEIGKLQLRLTESQDELRKEETKKAELRKALDSAEITAKSYEKRLKTGDASYLNCIYTGKAYIIPVFGIGSHGITTTAVSIADRLNKSGKSVCILDLDLVNPKVSSFYKGVNPISDLSESYGLNTTERTCVGALMQKGVPWFIDHRDELIKTVQENKQKGGRRVDYFSGLYAPINMVRILALDYTQLLTVLGNDYDYLVVDLGKIGASDMQDTLIQLFSRIGIKNSIVCAKEDDSIRNLILRLQVLKLSMKDCVWMLNMAKDSGQTPFIETALKNIPYRIMTFSSSIFGEKQLFSSLLLKGAFNEYVDDLLLRGQS